MCVAGALYDRCRGTRIHLVMANLGGAVVPFASVLPMLMGTESSGPLASALDEIWHQLTAGAISCCHRRNGQ